MSESTPPSAWQLAAQLGNSLLDPSTTPTASTDLVRSIRDLAAAAVATDLDPDGRAAMASEIDGLVQRLRSQRREHSIVLGRHPGGRVENLTQAGSGRLNPQALPLDFEPVEPADSSDGPVPVEVTGHCTLTDAHGGPPGRAHGGVVATMLDEAIGLAVVLAGAPGLTAGLNVTFRAGTPLHTPLDVRARYVRSDGRKHIAGGEILAGGEVTATAEGIFINPPS